MYRRIAVLALAFGAHLTQPAIAEVECLFHVRSTINGNERLSGSRFRVRDVNGTLRLEQRFADGLWYDFGNMMLIIRPGFRAYVHWPDDGPYDGRARMLTVHQSGNGSLAIHHGSAGGGSQLNRAWLYQGTCE